MQTLAKLDNGAEAAYFASGMAACNAVLQSLSPNTTVILPSDLYFNVRKLMDFVYARWNLKYVQIDMSDIGNVERAIAATPDASIIWAETPSNPRLNVTSVRRLSDLAKAAKLPLIVDATWPSPVILRPLDLGADLVLHSTTKYMSGHSDTLGGAIVAKDASDGSLFSRIRNVQKVSFVTVSK